MRETFRVGVTRDFLRADGSMAFDDIGLDTLDAAPGMTWQFLDAVTPELRADQVRGFDALLVLAPAVSAATLDGADRLMLVARFGVGYDNVDLDACTRAGVVVTITPDGVRRPVATSVMAFLLSLSLRMFDKDRLTRAARWADKLDYMGTGLIGRTLGLIGVGNIGREILTLARPFGLRFVAFDPFITAEQTAAAGAEPVDLDTLLRISDFVSINCPLTPETRHLIDAERLALMRPSAFLINTARGPVVDQLALTAALSQRRLAGAALDVFEDEPIDPHDPLLGLDNVILSPHAICWTDECFRGIGRSACRSILDIASGHMPAFVVNREVERNSRLGDRLAGAAARS